MKRARRRCRLRPRRVGEHEPHRLARQRVAQAVVRVDEGGARHVQAHRLEQHLVAVGGAVEGAGAGAVVRRPPRPRISASRPTRPSAYCSRTLRLLGVGQAARHRPAGDEDARQVAEVERADQQARARSCRRCRAAARRRRRRARARSPCPWRSCRARTGSAPCPAGPASRRRTSPARRRRPARSRRGACAASRITPGSARTAGAPRACRCRR